MSKQKFLILLRCLRFDDLLTRQKRKLINRLAPICELLKKFVSELYSKNKLLNNPAGIVKKMILPVSDTSRNVTCDTWFCQKTTNSLLQKLFVLYKEMTVVSKASKILKMLCWFLVCIMTIKQTRIPESKTNQNL